MFELGKWYKTSDGFDVEFISPIEKDGQYNVFRHTKELDYKPYYTNKKGKTAYGTFIILAQKDRPGVGEYVPGNDNRDDLFEFDEQGGLSFPCCCCTWKDEVQLSCVKCRHFAI